MSEIPGFVNGKEIRLEVADGSIRWRDVHKLEQRSIHASEIICVLPDRSTQDGGFQILFVQTSSQPPEAISDNESPHLGNLWASDLPHSLLSHHLSDDIPSHLNLHRSDGEANIHVIISVLSGLGQAKSFFQNVFEPFLSCLGVVNYRVHETKSEQTVLELARSIFLPRAIKGISQTIVLLSGDGGLVDLISVFFSENQAAPIENPSIALIPLGTGNAMANSVGLLSRRTFGLETLLHGVPRKLPAFVAMFSPEAKYVTNEGRSREEISNPSSDDCAPKIYGAVVASWGMHAALVGNSDTVEYRKFGSDRFKMAARELLFPSDGTETHRYKGTIKLTTRNALVGERCTRTLDTTEHMYVLVTLVSMLEKGFTISPESSPLDGRLRLVYFASVSPREAMDLMALGYQGGHHVYQDIVTYEEIESIRIDFDEVEEKWRRVCIDGKVITVEQGGWVEVHKETRELLNLIVRTS
jgi:diacylglycerol kinase family enzyme